MILNTQLIVDENGYGALHVACITGNLPLVRYLWGKLHMRFSHTLDDESNPLSLARLMQREEIVAYFCKKISDFSIGPFLAQIPLAVIVVNSKGSILGINVVAKRLLLYRKRDLIGKRINSLFSSPFSWISSIHEPKGQQFFENIRLANGGTQLGMILNRF